MVELQTIVFHLSTWLRGNGATVCGFSVLGFRAGMHWRIGPTVLLYNIAKYGVLQTFTLTVAEYTNNNEKNMPSGLMIAFCLFQFRTSVAEVV